MSECLPDGVVEVCLQELENEIEILIIFCADDVQQFDDIVVVELMQVAYLSVGALRVDRVLEGVEYFF
jgi:hypothetical protein